MNGIQTIQAALGTTQWLFNEYFKDLSDADLFVRPVPGANHLAWQLGHLVFAEIGLVKDCLPDVKYPALPPEWNEAYGKKGPSNDNPADFLKLAEYLSMFNEARQATITGIGKLTDTDLDRPTTGPMAKFAPKLGDLFILIANHTLMHGGQITVLRRKLGKPVLF